MNRDKFEEFHPGIQFLFFFAAVVITMCLIHPAFVLCSAVLAAVYLWILRGRKAWRLLGLLVVIFTVISLINPLVNPNGQIVLFTWLGGRPFCLESLYYGMALGGMSVTVLMWFACYNTVMTSDKFLYLFGRFAPSLSLMLTMVLRLVPDFTKKAGQIAGARKCIGKAGGSTKKEGMADGASILSSLTSWALEGGIVRADSMRSRGYGTGRRTNFSIYRWKGADRLLLPGMLVLLAAVLVCMVLGAASTSYVPHMAIAPLSSGKTLLGLLAYFCFLAIPTVLNIVETIKWHSLRSKI